MFSNISIISYKWRAEPLGLEFMASNCHTQLYITEMQAPALSICGFKSAVAQDQICGFHVALVSQRQNLDTS